MKSISRLTFQHLVMSMFARLRFFQGDRARRLWRSIMKKLSLRNQLNSFLSDLFYFTFFFYQYCVTSGRRQWWLSTDFESQYFFYCLDVLNKIELWVFLTQALIQKKLSPKNIRFFKILISHFISKLIYCSIEPVLTLGLIRTSIHFCYHPTHFFMRFR